MTDTIAVPVSMLVWAGSLITSAVIALLSINGHLLLRIYTAVTGMAKEHTETRGDVAMLKRHDENNRAEIAMMQRQFRGQE